MMQPTEFEMTTAGLRIAGLSWGDEDGPLVLAFHGWLDNAASFSRLGPIIAANGYRVVAVDLPGHGRSDHRSPDAHYHYINYSIDAVAIAHALVSDEARANLHLLGHSMGAGVSLLAAPALGEMVTKISAIEGLGPMTTPAPDAAETFVKAAASRKRVRERTRGTYADTEAAIARKAEAIGSSVEVARPIALRSLRAVAGGVQFGDDPRLSGRSFMRLTEEQVHSFLRGVAPPVEVVRATDGLQYPEAAFQGRLACLSEANVTQLEGGHHLHLSDAEAVAEALGYS